MALTKIVSGWQTGVDRGALDAALVAGFPCGGWCPAGRLAEDGGIPERYPLTEMPEVRIGEPAVRTARKIAEGYRARMLKNVQDSDGTVILFSGTLSRGTLSGGTLLTRKLCVRDKKALIVLDANELTALHAADAIVRFLDELAIKVLNVAGPRLSGWPKDIGALQVIGAVISRV